MFKLPALSLFLFAALAAPLAAAEYDLTVDEVAVTLDGRTSTAVGINGSVPGPVLRWKEGEDVVVRVTNRLDVPTSLHWHGILIPPAMDGVPGLNGFHGIAPGETFTYRFTLRQSGTYWYHAHSAFQEQQGVYGALLIEPAGAEPFRFDRDYTVMLSDYTEEDPIRILRNLKVDPGYYNNGRRTLLDFLNDAEESGFGEALGDRLDWGEMRMDPTDLADVTGYTFLVNGRTAADNETFLFAPGERVRLRIVNGSAMSYFDVRMPGLTMTVVAADGQNVQPVPVDEFRIAVAETYDVIVQPTEDKAFTLLAEPIDRSGYARATLAPRPGMAAAIPPLKRRAVLTMADMGAGMAGMDHGAAPGMAGMDHGSMPGMAESEASDGAPGGWADADTPDGARALTYADLRALKRHDAIAPAREIVVRLGGNMERYIWTIDGRQGDDIPPIELRYGERVRLTFVNETMMAHPMHLHGLFVELENGQPGERLPLKHIVSVAPGATYSALITADEPGEWAFHCHLLFHMSTGMMTKVVVARMSAEASP